MLNFLFMKHPEYACPLIQEHNGQLWRSFPKPPIRILDDHFQLNWKWLSRMRNQQVFSKNAVPLFDSVHCMQWYCYYLTLDHCNMESKRRLDWCTLIWRLQIIDSEYFKLKLHSGGRRTTTKSLVVEISISSNCYSSSAAVAALTRILQFDSGSYDGEDVWCKV